AADVAEVVGRRAVRDAGTARDLAQREALDARRGDELLRRGEERSTQVAVVIRARAARRPRCGSRRGPRLALRGTRPACLRDRLALDGLGLAGFTVADFTVADFTVAGPDARRRSAPRRPLLPGPLLLSAHLDSKFST